MTKLRGTELSFIALILVLHGAPGNSQSVDSVGVTPPIVFLEKAYFSFATPSGKNLLFEGQPTVHYFLYNDLANEAKQQRVNSVFWATPISAAFLVRMTKDSVQLQNGERSASEPVLTPSYRIGVRQQVFYLHHPADEATYQLYGVAFGLTHYSNGQHGCTYLGFTRDSMGNCQVFDSVVASHSAANVVDGDFSTTYFSEAVDARFAQQTDPAGTMRWQESLGIELRQDPLNFHPGGTNSAQARQYGQQEFDGRMSLEHRYLGCASGIVRLGGGIVRRWGGGMHGDLNAQEIELSYVFDRFDHAGVFFRQHFGFDYYNINFQNKSPFHSIGLMWDVGRLDHLKAR